MQKRQHNIQEICWIPVSSSTRAEVNVAQTQKRERICNPSPFFLPVFSHLGTVKINSNEHFLPFLICEIQFTSREANLDSVPQIRASYRLFYSANWRLFCGTQHSVTQRVLTAWLYASFVHHCVNECVLCSSLSECIRPLSPLSEFIRPLFISEWIYASFVHRWVNVCVLCSSLSDFIRPLFIYEWVYVYLFHADWKYAPFVHRWVNACVLCSWLSEHISTPAVLLLPIAKGHHLAYIPAIHF